MNCNKQGWVIQNADGRFMLSFKMGGPRIEIGWINPAPRFKTPQSVRGPFIFKNESDAQLMLVALAALLPKEFSRSSLEQIISEA